MEVEHVQACDLDAVARAFWQARTQFTARTWPHASVRCFSKLGTLTWAQLVNLLPEALDHVLDHRSLLMVFAFLNAFASGSGEPSSSSWLVLGG